MQETEREKWDSAAGDYQRVYALGLNAYNASLLRFWHEQGMLRPGCRVIDIGCGVGKYGTYLAELGYDVTLTDVSGEMLRRAAENMARFQTPWTLCCCDFDEITGREPVFAGGFDLAVSTMSPAVHDAATVRKMAAMTRVWCFLARFQTWEQPFRDTLMRRLGREPRRLFRDLNGDVEALIDAVREAGFAPEVRLVPYNWADRRTPEQMADYLCRRYYPDERGAERLRAGAVGVCQALSDPDGLVTDDVYTTDAWIYWKTEQKK